MIKKWGIVITWQQGIAQVYCEASEEYCSCRNRQSCSIRFFDKIAHNRQDNLEVVSLFPLVPGQRVEVGINEVSLLRSAFLVYMLPLLGFINSAVIFQSILSTDLAAACGGVAGGVTGFFYARYLSHYISKDPINQPMILQIDPSP
ncbi:MAG: SoxR reducing system RseC family protein [Sodalis sp. (in: enterobacteria)]